MELKNFLLKNQNIKKIYEENKIKNLKNIKKDYLINCNEVTLYYDFYFENNKKISIGYNIETEDPVEIITEENTIKTRNFSVNKYFEILNDTNGLILLWLYDLRELIKATPSKRNQELKDGVELIEELYCLFKTVKKYGEIKSPGNYLLEELLQLQKEAKYFMTNVNGNILFNFPSKRIIFELTLEDEVVKEKTRGYTEDIYKAFKNIKDNEKLKELIEKIEKVREGSNEEKVYTKKYEGYEIDQKGIYEFSLIPEGGWGDLYAYRNKVSIIECISKLIF